MCFICDSKSRSIATRNKFHVAWSDWFKASKPNRCWPVHLTSLNTTYHVKDARVFCPVLNSLAEYEMLCVNFVIILCVSHLLNDQLFNKGLLHTDVISHIGLSQASEPIWSQAFLQSSVTVHYSGLCDFQARSLPLQSNRSSYNITCITIHCICQKRVFDYHTWHVFTECIVLSSDGQFCA